MEMATNKKKLLITQSMSKVGWDLFAERGDIEAVQFPNTITTAGFPGTARASMRPSTAWRWA